MSPRRSPMTIRVQFARHDHALLAEHGAFLADFVLQTHQPIQQRLGPGRAPRHVHIDRNDLIDALQHAVGRERTARIRAAAHRDHPLGLGHLVVEPAQNRSHLLGHGAGHDHQVRLPRRGAKHLGAEPRDVEARGRRRHHLDGAARQPESHRPDGRLARPVQNAVDARGDEVVFETMIDQTHATSEAPHL